MVPIPLCGGTGPAVCRYTQLKERGFVMGSFEASLKKAPCPAPSPRARACVCARVCAPRIPCHSFAAPAHRPPVGSARGHICAGTGLTPATSAPGPGSPLPHLRRDLLGLRMSADDRPLPRFAGVATYKFLSQHCKVCCNLSHSGATPRPVLQIKAGATGDRATQDQISLRDFVFW